MRPFAVDGDEELRLLEIEIVVEVDEAGLEGEPFDDPGADAFELGEIPRAKLNPNGGAIAVGHPVGATGARLLLTTAHELAAGNHELGLALGADACRDAVGRRLGRDGVQCDPHQRRFDHVAGDERSIELRGVEVDDPLDEPVLLYGHSAGSGGALIAAVRNPEKIRLLFLEGVFAETREALLHLYIWASPFFGHCFGPMILFWMNLFYRGRLRRMTPCRLARGITMPVMLIHGEKDRRFPVRFAHQLKACFNSAPQNPPKLE